MGSEHPLLSQGATGEFNTVEKVENTLCSLFIPSGTPCKMAYWPRKWEMPNIAGSKEGIWDSDATRTHVELGARAFPHHSYPGGVMEPSRYEINPFYTCWLLRRSSRFQHVRNSHHLGMFQPWQWLQAQKLADFCKMCITPPVCVSHSRLKSHGVMGEVGDLILAET